MATYLELREVFVEGSLVNRTEVAVVVKAQAIFEEAAPSAERLAWAEGALSSSKADAYKFLKYVIADNKDVAASAIVEATDAALQTAVDAAIDKLYPVA